MITGEHAVVYGHPAVVAAIDQRMYVEVSNGEDGKVAISSDIADRAEYNLGTLTAEGPYRFILAAVLRCRSDLAAGLNISVRSEIDPTLGLGSSAAVTIATLGALCQITGRPSGSIHTEALAIVRAIQGRGSGADLAASLAGGMISYVLADDGSAATIAPLPDPSNLLLRYTGYKTPTSEVLAKVAQDWAGRPDQVEALYAAMGDNAARTIAALREGDWARAGPLMNDYQGLLNQLGVSDATIDAIIETARETDGLNACKISGSGLGDCVLAVGATPKGFAEVPLAREGLIVDD